MEIGDLIMNTIKESIRAYMTSKIKKYRESYDNNYAYEGKVTSNSRFVSIGFDDFRDSDFSLIIPLLKEYDARATFNRPAYKGYLSNREVRKISRLLSNGHEIGDHTWFHSNDIFFDPMFNGQNPDCVEGEQMVFPSNSEMRCDRGDGKNIFGIEIDELCKKSYNNIS